MNNCPRSAVISAPTDRCLSVSGGGATPAEVAGACQRAAGVIDTRHQTRRQTPTTEGRLGSRSRPLGWIGGCQTAGPQLVGAQNQTVLSRPYCAEAPVLSAGSTVGPVATVETALALLRSTYPIDFALVDINLRGVMAVDVADALMTRGTPFAFTTGYTTSIIPERYANVALLLKPYDGPRTPTGFVSADQLTSCHLRPIFAPACHVRF
jgi:hypothetical protein